MSDVFVSYSRSDSSFVQRLHKELADRGREAWVDWEDIAPTAEWMEEIRSAIEGAEAFAFVISPDSVASETCAIELDHALAHNKRIVPIVWRAVEATSVPPRLASLHWVFIRGDDEFRPGVDTLLEAIDTDLDWVRAHTRLLVRAREWESQEREGSYLLRGRDLTEVEDSLSKSEDLDPRPTALQTQFVVASRRAAARRQRGVAGALTVGLVIAIGLSVVAWRQRNEAVRQAEIARSRQLVANAQQQLPINPDLSLALILESAAVRMTETTEQALRAILSQSRIRAVLKGYRQGVNGQAMSPDGQLVVKQDDNGSAHLWRLDDATPVKRLASCPRDIETVAFSPAGELVATGHRDGRLLVWSINSGERVAELSTAPEAVTNAAFDPAGKAVATLSTGGTARLWSVETGEVLQAIPGTARHAQSDLSFDPTGRALSVERDYKRTVYRLPRSTPIRETEGFFTHDGLRWFAETCRACDAEVHSVGGEIIAKGFGGAFGSSAVFSSDGNLLLRAGVCFGPGACDYVARLYSATSGALLNTLEGHSDRVYTAVFSADDRFVVTASRDGTARVWETRSGRPLATLMGHSDEVFSAAFSANGRHVMTASRDGTARVWDAGTGVDRFEIESDQEAIARVVFPNGGESIVTIGEGGSTRWWQQFSGAQMPRAADSRPTETQAESLQALVARIRDSGVVITEFSQSPRGTYLFTQSMPFEDGDGKARLWDVSTSRQLIELAPSAGAGAVAILAIDPDERLMATTENCMMTIDCDRIVRLRELTSGRTLRALRGHGNQIYEGAFSTTGKLLATTDGDGAMLLWEVETGRLVADLPGDGKIHFSPDGSSLAMVRGRKMRVYHCEACGSVEVLLERARRRSVRPLTCQERRAYVDADLVCP